jgi:hypothetical protein
LDSIFNSVNGLVYQSIYDSISTEESESDLEEEINRALDSKFIDDTEDVQIGDESLSENCEYDFQSNDDRGAVTRFIDVSEERKDEVDETYQHCTDTGEVSESDEMIKEHIEGEFGTCGTFLINSCKNISQLI